MNLRIKNTAKIKQSQVQPGFAIHGFRLFTAIFALLAILAVFADLAPMIEGQGKYVLPRAQATASAIDKGVQGEYFTQTQKRYIQRAVAARPDNLNKMHGATILAAFNSPSLVRSDLPTVVWQYRTNSCVLDIYFKSDKDDVVLAPVVHYEIRGRSIDANATLPDEQKCIKSLMPSLGAPRMISVNAFYKSLIR